MQILPRRRQHPPRRRLHHVGATRPPVQGDVDARSPIARRRARRSASQFADGTVTRGKKFEGIWSDATRASTSSTASPSAPATCRPTPPSTTAWSGTTTTPTRRSRSSRTSRTTRSRGRRPVPGVRRPALRRPDNVTVTPWGTLILAEDGVRASHVLSAVPGGPTYADRPQPAGQRHVERRARPTRSSPARRSRPTARSCSSTSRTRASPWPSPAPGRSTSADARQTPVPRLSEPPRRGRRGCRGAGAPR